MLFEYLATVVQIIYGASALTLDNMELVKNHCSGGGQRQESPDWKRIGAGWFHMY